MKQDLHKSKINIFYKFEKNQVALQDTFCHDTSRREGLVQLLSP